MTITEIIQAAHAQARKSGFYDDGGATNIGERIALMHSELSEALEEHRAGHAPLWYSIDKNDCFKPEGIAAEFADVIIRIADTCGFLGINLEEAINEKMLYNAKRPHKHGKAY